jgi:T5orf172 domain
MLPEGPSTQYGHSPTRPELLGRIVFRPPDGRPPYAGCKRQHICRSGVVYAFDFQFQRESDWKIGQTVSWAARSLAHRSFCGREPLERAMVVPVACVLSAERYVHRRLAQYRLGRKEWFRCSRREVLEALDQVREVE